MIERKLLGPCLPWYGKSWPYHKKKKKKKGALKNKKKKKERNQKRKINKRHSN